MEINRDIGALEKLNSILEKLKLNDELESFYSLGFKAGIEYARKNPKRTG